MVRCIIVDWEIFNGENIFVVRCLCRILNAAKLINIEHNVDIPCTCIRWLSSTIIVFYYE